VDPHAGPHTTADANAAASANDGQIVDDLKCVSEAEAGVQAEAEVVAAHRASKTRPDRRAPLGRVDGNNDGDDVATAAVGTRSSKHVNGKKGAHKKAGKRQRKADVPATLAVPDRHKRKRGGSVIGSANGEAGGAAMELLSPGQLKTMNKKNPKGETPLHRACVKGDLAKLVK
jgi:hypothetical protein